MRGDVDILLFPVKRGGSRWQPRLPAGPIEVGILCCALLLTACGYRAIASHSPGERLCVRAAPALVPDSSGVQGALDGARQELARHGALGESGVYPCLVLELLRVDEAPAGIVASAVNAAQQPEARGTAVSVLGRAWVETESAGTTSRDTGDLRRTARQETTSGLAEGTRHDRGLEAAAQQLGRDLAKRVLGLPTPSDDLP